MSGSFLAHVQPLLLSIADVRQAPKRREHNFGMAIHGLITLSSSSWPKEVSNFENSGTSQSSSLNGVIVLQEDQKCASDPRPPHTRQKYEQTSGQNMTSSPNASKQGKFGSLGAIFLFIFLPCMWGLGSQEESPEERFSWGNVWGLEDTSLNGILRSQELSPLTSHHY